MTTSKTPPNEGLAALPGSVIRPPEFLTPLPDSIMLPCDYSLAGAVMALETQLGTIEAYNRMVAYAKRLKLQITRGEARDPIPGTAIPQNNSNKQSSMNNSQLIFESDFAKHKIQYSYIVE